MDSEGARGCEADAAIAANDDDVLAAETPAHLGIPPDSRGQYEQSAAGIAIRKHLTLYVGELANKSALHWV